MAKPIVQEMPFDGPGKLVTWLLTSTDDVAEPYLCMARPQKTVQMYGDFSGAEIAVRGSNDPAGDVGTNYGALTSEDGAFPTEISFIAAGALITGLVKVREHPIWIKPVKLSGTPSVAGITVALSLSSARSRA